MKKKTPTNPPAVPWAGLWKEVVKSDTSLLLIVLSTLGMAWYATIHGRDLPEGYATVLVGIFGAKAAHGVFNRNRYYGTDEHDAP